jgi:hypothetical protein
MKTSKAFACLALLLALAACNTPPATTAGALPGVAAQSPEIGALTYRAVDNMLGAVPDLTLGRTPVVVGSIADVQRIGTSSPLGNMVADMLRNRLTQRGVAVTELRLRSAVLMEKNQGEMALSRERRAILPPPAASIIATGTYTVGDQHVYISLKLISLDTARILAGTDYAVPRAGDLDAMLH